MATILLVDDEKILRTLVRVALEKENHEVLEAAGASQALAVARKREHAIDLLITELALGKKSGLELAETLEARRPGLRSLFLSRFPHPGNLLDEARRASRVVVSGPFDLRALVEQVNNALETEENGRQRKPPASSQPEAPAKRRAGRRG
ncbi:MAG: response regulator [Bryobacteraceae bacterium]|nr:response regulator [Bryobacteraceae bacterium]